MALLAQKLIISQSAGTGSAADALEIEGPLKNITHIADLINILFTFIYPLAAILMFFFLVWGGWDFLLSGGSPEKIKSGKARITYALAGFLLLISSFLIVRLVAKIFGLDGGLF